MATEQRHIRRIVDTQANARTDLDSGQSAILTDQNEEWVYNNSDASKMYYVANQKYWNGAAFVDCDVTFGDVTVNDDLYQSEYRYHLGDTNTYDRFRADRYGITLGGVEFLDMQETTQDVVEWNAANNDIDFIVNTTIADTLFVRGGDGVVEIGGSGAQTWKTATYEAVLALGDVSAIAADGDEMEIVTAAYYDITNSRWETTGGVTSARVTIDEGITVYADGNDGSGGPGDALTWLQLFSAKVTIAGAGQFLVGDDMKMAVRGAVGNAVFTVNQESSGGAIACVALNQDDESEGFIDFVGSDRGSILTSTTNSVASVRVELSGTKYIIPLYTDA